MKYVALVLMVVVVLVGGISCSRCSFNAGVGYRSTPPTMPDPIIYQLETAQKLGFSPVYIDLIMKFLEAGGFEALFHKDNRTDLGVWLDFIAE